MDIIDENLSQNAHKAFEFNHNPPIVGHVLERVRNTPAPGFLDILIRKNEITSTDRLGTGCKTLSFDRWHSLNAELVK